MLYNRLHKPEHNNRDTCMAPDLNASKVTNAPPPHLPVIDLSELDGPQHDLVVETLVKVAETFGFFQVVNHGMPVEFLEELKDSVNGFFNQPEEKKAIYGPMEGTPMTLPSVAYYKGSGTDLIDVLHMNRANAQDALENCPDSCKEVMSQYQKSTSKLAERILNLLMSNLGVTLDESMADEYMGEKDISMNYFPIFDSQNHGILAIRSHTDPTTLTVLLQDHIGGLFGKLNEQGDVVGNYKGEWVEIKPIPGALIILFGDALQVLSNGKYKACDHYVRTTGRETRLSVPAFMYPRWTAKIGPLPQVVEKDDGKPLYRDFLFGEYRSNANNNYSAASPDMKGIQCSQILH